MKAFILILLLLLLSCSTLKQLKSPKPRNFEKVEINCDSVVVMNTSVEDYSTNNHYVRLESANYEAPKPNSVKVVNIPAVHYGSSSTYREGQIVYNIPDTMIVRETYTVWVRISQDKKTTVILSNATGVVKRTTIPTSKAMEVSLIDKSPADNKMFDIKSTNSNQQLVEEEDNTFTEWRWDVTPLRAGKSSLKLVVSIMKDGLPKEVIYEDKVLVVANVSNQTLFFIKSYWQYLISTFALPFFIWLYKRKQSNKQTQP